MYFVQLRLTERDNRFENFARLRLFLPVGLWNSEICPNKAMG